ncbi:short-chain dehydrogenase [Mycobacterium intermedium]|uniref:Short-chain dehydrogenase n=1 Tax=Mycobacterium intermedium TaxID=28445 RepID=A0A1E3SA22_MYCIE|nr:short-chain dehydrogenase/reductase [Mycobacterium intermedium]MCV6967674.1 SDR family NAD(P)-dependent oxidoreductase [Mycobacterium intermedium]ODQ98492.1 short-chain dehydrogenase [Mycobacterium intermedium]OPE48080.1 short-chain dehydrogenase [Mycobacterium intermedium]ORB03503.1 short-chain dehydrogenase [Mycobacterium intermedium]
MQPVRTLARTTSRIARSLPVINRVLGSHDSLPLEERVVFVTGAARGLGAEVARQAHADGAHVALVGRRLEPLQKLAGTLGDRAAAFEADVTDVEALQRAADDTVATFGGIDVVVANAGIAPPDQTVATISPDDFERTVEVDLLGQWRTARATLPALIDRQGHILFVGSIYAFFNGVLAASYAVSKAGVEQLARALRVELVPHGVTVGIAYLGFIDTDLAADVFSQQHAAQVRQAVPGFLTRPITVADAAEAVLDGVQRRAARVTAPAWVGPMLATRGITTRLMDSILLHNADVAAAITGAETDSDSDGSA